MKPSRVLSEKQRRSWLTQYRHRMMRKVYQNFAGLGMEVDITFDQSKDNWLSRLDKMEGEAQGGKLYAPDADQYDADYQAARVFNPTPMPTVTPMEAYESGFKIAPGELPFYAPRGKCFYDADKKAYKLTTAPFWWKRMPGDDGLSQNLSMYYQGQGTRYMLEPTADAVQNGDNQGARFEPATPEEAAEIEAEEQYERDIRNSMMQAVADLNIVEVPPYYVVGQKTWMSITPWYKAKAMKGTLTEEQHGAQSWDLLVAWGDKNPKKADA